MKPRRVKALLFAAFAASLFLAGRTAEARYPRISPIPDVRIDMNTSSPILRFWISDETTAPESLALEARSDNPALIPADDDHIDLEGRGQDRSIIISPEPGQTGFANITIIVTDTDGDAASEAFQVRVDRPPNL